jgi:hypothetical protein
MIYTFIINGKETKKDVPVQWADVSFQAFLHLEKCGDDIIKVISFFTGIEYDILLKCKIPMFDDLVSKLKFLNEKIEPVVPKSCLGYTIPKDLEYESVGQYKDLKDYVKEAVQLIPSEQFSKYTTYCAVYACKAKHGDYDFQKAEAMADEFLNAPCPEVIGIGNFTLLRLTALTMHINPSYQAPLSRMKKFKLALTAWLKTLVPMAPWFIWRKKLGGQKTNY